jgi:hypothetical protein
MQKKLSRAKHGKRNPECRDIARQKNGDVEEDKILERSQQHKDTKIYVVLT